MFSNVDYICSPPWKLNSNDDIIVLHGNNCQITSYRFSRITFSSILFTGIADCFMTRYQWTAYYYFTNIPLISKMVWEFKILCGNVPLAMLSSYGIKSLNRLSNRISVFFGGTVSRSTESLSTLEGSFDTLRMKHDCNVEPG